MNKKKLLFIIALILSLNTFAQIYVPNSFTPNNDGINDYITAYTSDTLDVFEFTIFNSWGEPIWFTTNPEDKWDGGDDYYSPSNSYTYILRYRRKDYSFIKTQRGFITLIR
jgi:gliding motility-associated-like protein